MEMIKLRPFGRIYLITSLMNGKLYVGKTTLEPTAKWQDYKIYAKYENRVVSKALRKYGPDKFKFEILCECFSLDSLNKSETFFIWLLASHLPSFGYNMTMGGDGLRPNKETRESLSKKSKEWFLNPENKERYLNALYAKVGKPEWLRHNSEAHSNPPTEVRRKMSEARGRFMNSDRGVEYKKRAAVFNSGRVFSEESRKKISAAHTGKIRSAEWRQHMSESQKIRCAKRRLLLNQVDKETS